MVITCVPEAISFINFPTLYPVSPPIPVSISSNTIVSTMGFSLISDLNASIIRDISPPEATLFNGFGVSPGFVEI